MSYFNPDQEDHMAYLATIPATERCWCGWYELGRCPSCPRGATAADKLASRCQSCRNAPPAPGMELIHLRNCPEARE